MREIFLGNAGDKGFSSVSDSHKDAFSDSLCTYDEKRGEPIFWALGVLGVKEGLGAWFLFYKKAEKNLKSGGISE